MKIQWGGGLLMLLLDLVLFYLQKQSWTNPVDNCRMTSALIRNASTTGCLIDVRLLSANFPVSARTKKLGMDTQRSHIIS